MTVILGFALVLGAMPCMFAHQPARSTHTASSNPSSDNRESQDFLASLRARVLNNWLLPDGNNVVVLVATVNAQGDVTDVSTSESKADPLAIEAARNAFEKAQPLGRPPSRYAGDCKITLTFTSKVDPHGDSTSDLTSRIDQIKTGANEGKQETGAQAAPGQ
jgi:TonB family protein